MSDDKRAELLYAHYEFTLNTMHRSISLRYRYLLFTLLLVVLNLGLLSFPAQLHEFSQDLLARNQNLPDAIDFQAIALGVTFAMMLLVVRYLQTVVTVSRQHKYTHCLEDKLNEYFGKDLITYEGKFYKNDRPAILKWHGRLYAYLIPALFLFASGWKIVEQVRQLGDAHIVIQFLNGFFSASIGFFVLLYWWYLCPAPLRKLKSRIARSGNS